MEYTMYSITITQSTVTQQLRVGCCHIVKYVSCLVQNYLIAIPNAPNHLMDCFALLLTIDGMSLMEYIYDVEKQKIHLCVSEMLH